MNSNLLKKITVNFEICVYPRTPDSGYRHTRTLFQQVVARTNLRGNAGFGAGRF